MKRFVITVAMVMAPASAFAGVTKYYDIRGYVDRVWSGFWTLWPAILLLGLAIYAIHGLTSPNISGNSKSGWLAVVGSLVFLAPLFAALDPRYTRGWNLVVIGGALLGFMPPLSLIIFDRRLDKSSRLILAGVMLPFSIVLTMLYLTCWIFYVPGVGYR